MAASTQNQAKSALLFLYREVLGVQLPWLDEIVVAKDRRRLPVVLTPAEVRALLHELNGTMGLVASLLYGTGMRLLEGLRLRVKDVEFARREVLVRDGNVMVTTHGDGSVRRWAWRRFDNGWTSREIYRHPGAPQGVALLDEGSRVATVDSDGRLVVARDLHLVAPQRLQWQSTVDIQQAWLDAGQGRIGIVTPQGPRWIDPAARSVTVAPAEAVPSLLRGHGLDAVARQGALALKRKDKTIVLEGPGGTRTLPLDAPLATAAFSADGRFVYTLANHTVRAWATDTAEPAGPQAAVGELAGRLVASPDGRWLAIVHAAPLQIGKLARGVRQASVSLLSLPDLQLRVQRAELDIDANDFAGPEAMFSPDSHTLMFAGETRLSLFDIASMRRMDATVPLGDGVKVLGFLNGRWPLWLADTRTGRLLTLDVRREALADWACQLAGRSLTTAEWTRYLGNERPYAPRCKPSP